MPPTHLVLGTMPPDATPESHIAAGEWCFLDCATQFPQWMDKFTIVDTRPTPSEDEQYTAKLMGWGVHQLHLYAERHNARLREPLSSYVWELLLGRWCITIIPFIGLAYRITQQAVAHYGHVNLTVHTAVPTKCAWVTKEDLFQNLISPNGFHRLLSKIVEKLAPPTWTLMPEFLPLPYSQPRTTLLSMGAGWLRRKVFHELSTGPGLRGILHEANQRITHKLLDLPIPYFPFTSFWQRLFLSAILLTNRKGNRRTHPLLRERYPNPGNEFPRWMADLLWEYIPNNLQHIETRVKRSKSIFKSWIMDLRFSSEEQYLIKYANLASGGTRLYTVQHAPTYFAIPDIGIASAEEYNHSGFLKWGGEFQESFPAPAPPVVYCKLYGKHKEEEASIYYILDKQRPVDIPNCFSLFRPVRENMKNLEEFYSSLPNALKNRLWIRHYIDASGSFDSRLWTLCKKIPVAEGDNIYNMSRVRIVVVNYVASSFGQAMILNTPCLWISPPKNYTYPNEIHNIFALLHAVGIMHGTAKTAATFLAQHWDNISAWWKSTPVQEARNLFTKKYLGCYSRHPILEWARLLRRL
ncbi:hypothetical protein [uncultured Desulfovibrio sp.]|uniref:hypothetical protein n=1 Tax=uncultured Desulfovibrio sp. TaxID=167968 RepID=UPI00265EEF2F|nr:hypothetical protein [uncultured Desulfovibrio sp.]